MISKELLKIVLLEQRHRVEALKKESFVIRNYVKEIEQFIKLKHAVIITGVRRCGKSILLLEIINKFYNENYYFINFEDERLSNFESEDFSTLHETFIELFGNHNTFFLDEVQNISGWEKWVRRLYEDKFKFFITGSNANLLSKELATLLTGRHIQISIYPFAFDEYLKMQGFLFEKDDFYLTERRAVIMKHFSRFVDVGGFPEYITDQKIEILQEYFNDILYHDVAKRYSIGNINQISEVARYVVTNTGNLTTYRKLTELTKSKSVTTTIKYFTYLENAYLLIKIPFFSYLLKKQISNPFKTYAIDTGLRNAISFKFSKDKGRIYENIVAIQLKRSKKEVYYWHNTQNKEVDFVIKNRDKVEQLIQVCYDLLEEKTKAREIKSLVNASAELKCNKLLVLTENYEGEEKVKNKKIEFIPLWKWLLQ
ncbi:ATP-binding protein [Candidatus Woesearchaeota archaeon]|nr:ATP-binding protein [Candidatus Woesearchaeota archaeon]